MVHFFFVNMDVYSTPADVLAVTESSPIRLIKGFQQKTIKIKE